jgi:hypothetical protein
MFHHPLFLIFFLLFCLLLVILTCLIVERRYCKRHKERQINLLRQFHSRLFAATSDMLGKAEQIDLASKYIVNKSSDFDKSIRLTCSELVVLTDSLQALKKDIDNGKIKPPMREEMLSSATLACQLARQLNTISSVQHSLEGQR